ncbi:MAG: hypothetical protein DMG57_24815 [Acidobacteria bacterium]|nr:MAG: hypothetical protein DMG57_24815 [Acidobacteriota bacterium]
MNCPHCAEPLAERGVFCKACAGQARCVKCRELLEPGAIACVECGTRIGQPVEATDSIAATQTLPPNRNTLSYQEDRNTRKFEASLTDSAMHGLGDVFGELFAQRGLGRAITQPNGRTRLRNDVVLEDLKQLPPAAPSAAEQAELPVDKTTHPQGRTKNAFSRSSAPTARLLNSRIIV